MPETSAPKRSTRTPAQSARLEQFLEHCAHGLTGPEAALLVGWSEHTGKKYANRYRPRITELAVQRFQTALPAALKTIVNLTEGAKSEAVRLAAANRVCDGAGHGVVHKQEVTHRTDADLVDDLLRIFNGDKAQAVAMLKATGTPIPPQLQAHTLQ